MSVSIEFSPDQFSPRVLRLIMAKAEQWKCSPGEALARLLENAAGRAGFPPEPETPSDLKKAA